MSRYLVKDTWLSKMRDKWKSGMDITRGVELFLECINLVSSNLIKNLTCFYLISSFPFFLYFEKKITSPVYNSTWGVCCWSIQLKKIKHVWMRNGNESCALNWPTVLAFFLKLRGLNSKYKAHGTRKFQLVHDLEFVISVEWNTIQP